MNRFLFLYLLLSSLTLRAELVFETTKVDAGRASMSDTSFTASYPFKNTGDNVVTIASIESSCGCTTPNLEKRVYQPGEGGEITAVFEFGRFTGEQHKKVTVTTAGDKPQRIQLDLLVEIPEVLSVRPRVAYWQLGDEELGPKTFEVFLGEGIDAKIELDNLDPSLFDVTLAPAPEGADASYVITAAPVKNDLSRLQIKIKAIAPDGSTVGEQQAFLLTRRPRLPASSAPRAP